jgi:hypothetical protein
MLASMVPAMPFQTIVESMQGLLVVVTPIDGPSFDASLVGGNEDDDSDQDEVQVYRVDDIDLEPVGEPEYVRVTSLRLCS